MTLRNISSIVILISCLSLSAPAQEELPNLLAVVHPFVAEHAYDFGKTVVPIAALKLSDVGIEGKFGTGFCLDPECRFIGTNYHVALAAHPHKIKGEKVNKQYLATGPGDADATPNDGPSVGPMRYTLSRDLAIFELRHPISRYHGVGFSLDDLALGQEVDIYAYPKESINPIRKLLSFHGAFRGQTTTGLLAFDYSLSGDKAICPGASGGLVVDAKSRQIVGILSATERSGEAIALAVPVQALADFVLKVRPQLAQEIFPPTDKISPLAADIYPKYAPPLVDTLQHRPPESSQVTLLRSRAQLLADSIRNFIAVQTFAWGSGAKPPVAAAAYEVRVLDGYQKFRKYPDGKREYSDVPLPPLNTVMATGGEWSELPEMVGTELKLKIHQAPDTVVNERRIRVFQYRADPEDGICKWNTILDFIVFAKSHVDTVGCYGEVWTDEETNILRMSEHLELTGRWKEFQSVVIYGWLRRTNEAPKLIPQTISSQAEYNKKIYWCRGRFMQYQVFSSRVKMAAE